MPAHHQQTWAEYRGHAATYCLSTCDPRGPQPDFCPDRPDRTASPSSPVPTEEHP